MAHVPCRSPTRFVGLVPMCLPDRAGRRSRAQRQPHLSRAGRAAAHSAVAGEPALTDEGIKGAQQGLVDNQTTGRFLKHSYALKERLVPEDGDVVAAVRCSARRRRAAVRRRSARPELLAIAPAADAAGAILLDARTSDDDAARPSSASRASSTSRRQPLDEGRRAGAVPGLEALAALVPDPGLPSRGQGARGCLQARGHQVRRQDRRRQGLRGHAAGSPHR